MIMKRSFSKTYFLFVCLFLSGLVACQSGITPAHQPQPEGVSAYLDIETTGFNHSKDDITVIGVYLDKGSSQEFRQLVGDEITAESLTAILQNVNTLYTYNGTSFDLPFIRKKLGLDLTKHCKQHIDLMYICQRKNLYGGLKEVEKKLGISREGGKTLLEYNKEDTVNLSQLKRALDK
jgi:hypothetical protein